MSGLERRDAEEALRIDLLRQRQAAATDNGDYRHGLQERHDLISAAIDLIVDDAVTQAIDHPTRYILDLLARPARPSTRRAGRRR